MTFGNRNWITTALLATTTWLGMASTGDATLFGCLHNRQTAYRVPTTCGTCGATPIRNRQTGVDAKPPHLWLAPRRLARSSQAGRRPKPTTALFGAKSP